MLLILVNVVVTQTLLTEVGVTKSVGRFQTFITLKICKYFEEDFKFALEAKSFLRIACKEIFEEKCCIDKF